MFMKERKIEYIWRAFIMCWPISRYPISRDNERRGWWQRAGVRGGEDPGEEDQERKDRVPHQVERSVTVINISAKLVRLC